MSSHIWNLEWKERGHESKRKPGIVAGSQPTWPTLLVLGQPEATKQDPGGLYKNIIMKPIAL